MPGENWGFDEISPGRWARGSVDPGIRNLVVFCFLFTGASISIVDREHEKETRQRQRQRQGTRRPKETTRGELVRLELENG